MVSAALRWGPHHRKTRSVLIPVGLNLTVLAFLGALLAAATEPGALAARWTLWLWPAGVAAGIGTLAFRFPRSVGAPLALLAVALVWMTMGALKEFAPLSQTGDLPTVQPLSDRELVTAFALRVDEIAPPRFVSLPVLYRWRVGDAAPAEWWWAWAQSRGWARSTGVALPLHPLKFGVYRLVLSDRTPEWKLEKPELSPP